MKGFAYIDNSKVLHIVADEEIAKQYTGTDGKYKEVDMAYEYGYPVYDKQTLAVYSDGREKEDRYVPQEILDLIEKIK
ncbi:hypothetical protein [Paenibacillus medicaginis]|uniref:DUF4367 domain-containing protein n=1 Tax=Paenibacillus medicaginis TaxID=1470560 RepID=A0ABV5BUZ1_9BACL